jgi:metallo-beta-lactamase family protein
MSATLRFLGAARTVTGSRYLVDSGSAKVLVDCGLFQERALRARNYEPFAVPPAEVNAVILTHAHVDHCGYLPRMVRQGFAGPVYCTEATAELARIILLDTAHIEKEDAEFKAQRHEREGRGGERDVEPLYTVEDVRRTLPLLKGVSFRSEAEVAGGISATFHEAGHILGSAMVRLTIPPARAGATSARRTLLFSGDIGRWDKPIIRDPTLFDAADYVVMESTYGDRRHEDPKDLDSLLEEAIVSTYRRGGNVVMPSFAVGRTQEVLYHLNRLLRADRIPHLMVFVDSPMAVEVTKVFSRHAELYDEEMSALVRRHESPFDFPNLKLVSKTEESKAINHLRGTAVIVAGSGMCTAGRIKHHLVHNISREESTLLFVGYQAAGTLGREITGGAREVRIQGETRPVRARVVELHGFSAHADQEELHRWAGALDSVPRRFFVTHGEPEVAERYAASLRERTKSDVVVPEHGDTASLD